MSYVMSRCKLALLTSLLSLSLTSTANAGSCDLKLIKEYTSVIDFRPSSMLCGADMGFLIIKLKQHINKNLAPLGAIRLVVKNSSNINVTRYNLYLSSADQSSQVIACLNNSYLDNSKIIFSFPIKEMKTTENTRSVKMSSLDYECKIPSTLSL